MRAARVGAWLAATALLATAVLKLVAVGGDRPEQRYLLSPGSTASHVVALAELGLAAMLLFVRTRRIAATVLTAFLAVGALWATKTAISSGPSCGCFGNVLEVGAGWQLLVSGTLMALLAPACHIEPVCHTESATVDASRNPTPSRSSNAE